MDLNNYLDNHEKTKVENKLLKFAIIIVGISSIISAIFTYSAVKYQKVVILPPVVDEKIVISGNDVSDSYLKLYSKYISNLLLNYTPATCADQFADLLSLSTPTFHSSLDKKLKEIGSGVSKLNISSAFFPGKIKIDRKKREITVEGIRDQRARNQPISNDRKKYLIQYRIINGRLKINGLAEKV